MDGMALVIVHTIGAGVGILLAGPFFGCRLHPAKAFAAAGLASLLYVVPTVGFALSLVALVWLVGIWGTGDWDDALYTALISRGGVLIVAMLWAQL